MAKKSKPKNRNAPPDDVSPDEIEVEDGPGPASPESSDDVPPDEIGTGEDTGPVLSGAQPGWHNEFGKTATLTMQRDMALGNGVRKKGERLAQLLLAPGVEIEEIVNAGLNQSIATWTETNQDDADIV